MSETIIAINEALDRLVAQDRYEKPYADAARGELMWLVAKAAAAMGRVDELEAEVERLQRIEEAAGPMARLPLSEAPSFDLQGIRKRWEAAARGDEEPSIWDMEQLLAEVDRYREALQRIANHPWRVADTAESELQSVKEIARAAVGGDPE